MNTSKKTDNQGGNSASSKAGQSGPGKVTARQIAAMAGVILLFLLYGITLIAALADTTAAGSLFKLCLLATVVVPFMLWIYTWLYGRFTGRHTIADFDTGAANRDPNTTDDGKEAP